MKSTKYPKIGKVFYRNKAEGLFIYKEIFEDFEYDHDKLSLPENPVIIDVGANIGLFSLYMNKKTNGKANIFAFEPAKEIYDTLQQNLTEHQLLDSVKAFNFGLADVKGEKTFSYYKNLSAISSYIPDIEKSHREVIEDPDKLNFLIEKSYPRLSKFLNAFPFLYRIIIPIIVKQSLQKEEMICAFDVLGNVIETEGITQIDLLKIDAEGAEMDILRSLHRSDWDKVKFIMMEGHNVNERQEMIDLLEQHGFSVELEEIFNNFYKVYAFREDV